jgi:hypothetical protein
LLNYGNDDGNKYRQRQKNGMANHDPTPFKKGMFGYMACKGCGAIDLNSVFGSCLRCTILAGISAACFWSLYALTTGHAMSRLITWPLAAFAVVVTLVLLGHVAGHISNRLNG